MAKKTTKKKSKPSLKKPGVPSKPKEEQKKNKPHPWRLCPSGEHWVRSHPLHVPPSKTHTEGWVTTRGAHCALNPSRKDHLYPHEIEEMSKLKLKKAKKKPCPINLGFGDLGTKYDDLIAGWVQYWNDIFGPKDPLDPNLVKALIATESSFEKNALANKKNQKSARGLMQVTDSTRKILGDEKGELKDHFISITRKELNDPSTNICAGVRWLFQKRKLASPKSGREANWEDVIYKYKGCDTVSPDQAKDIMKKFQKKLSELKKCAKK